MYPVAEVADLADDVVVAFVAAAKAVVVVRAAARAGVRARAEATDQRLVDRC